MKENKAKIRNFLSGLFRSQEWADDTNIFERGFVDSLAAIQLVLFVEQAFDISVGDEDLDLVNFSSVDAISELVGRKAYCAAAA
ncbi:MAG TPA: acyl carrier protein [Pyrinomonadaceae bacterium]|jgi:acyl carrier protein|nr:acyl carrier protein [Pyrinomonadaceae bacterium]